MGRRRVVALLAVLAAAAVPVARAATLVTAEGARIRVEPASRIFVPLARTGSAAPTTGLAYEVVDAGGRSHAGIVPGTAHTSSAAPFEPVLAQEPITGEIFLVFVATSAGQRDLAFTTWGGQSWAQPLRLTDDAAADAQPRLCFRADGDAVLAWRQQAAGGQRVLVRHFDLSPAGELRAHAFLDLGDPEIYLQPAGGPLAWEAGLAHLAAAADGRVYIVLADPATERSGVLGLDLHLFGGGNGIGASPVPVTFLAVSEPHSGGGSSGPPLTIAGDVLETWRLELPVGVGIYWFEPTRVRGLVVVDGAPGRLLDLERPASDDIGHLMMARALRSEVFSPARRTMGLLDRDRAAGGSRR